MPAEAQADRSATARALPDAVTSASTAPVTPTNANFNTPTPVTASAAPAARAVPAVVEVHKCVMPEGDAAYSDGPCPAGAHATTLRLPRDLHASASL